MAEADFDLDACLAGLRRGNEQAAAAFVQNFYPLVLKLVRSHLPRRSSEEDLCQVIFIKTLSNLEQYSGKVPIAHWISRIAVNTCLNALKAEAARPEMRWADLSAEQAAVLEALSTASGELDPGAAAASRDLVETLLGALNPSDRLVVTMLHLDGYSLEDVKQVTGWNIATVKVRAFRARKKLRDMVEDMMKEGRL